MMKVKTKTDVITNSSSEVYCMITSNPDTIKTIYSKLSEYWESDVVGDGGLWYRPEDDPKRIGVEIGHEAEGSGVWEMAQYGFRRLMQDLRDSGLEFELDYETKDYD